MCNALQQADTSCKASSWSLLIQNCFLNFFKIFATLLTKAVNWVPFPFPHSLSLHFPTPSISSLSISSQSDLHRLCQPALQRLWWVYCAKVLATPELINIPLLHHQCNHWLHHNLDHRPSQRLYTATCFALLCLIIIWQIVRVCRRWVEWDSHCVDSAVIVFITTTTITTFTITTTTSHHHHHHIMVTTTIIMTVNTVKIAKISITIIIMRFTISPVTKWPKDQLDNFAGTGMLTCVPPYLSQGLVVHTLKNYIKVFQKDLLVLSDLVTFINWDFMSALQLFTYIEPYLKGFLTMFIGIPYLTMCATRTEMTQVRKRR